MLTCNEMKLENLTAFPDLEKPADETTVNVTRTLSRLIKRGIVKKSEKGLYEFTDPLFRKFIERKF